MAVNKVRNGEICKKPSTLMTSRRDLENSCMESTTEHSTKALKQIKKDLKKPELPRYRPGMGLHQKNSIKIEDSVNSIAVQNVCVGDELRPKSPDQLSTKQNCEKSPVITSKPQDIEKDGSAVQKKSNKSRRPDKQVYTPKPRIAAKLQGLSHGVPEDSKTGTNETGKKSTSVEKEINCVTENVNHLSVNSDHLQHKNVSVKMSEPENLKNCSKRPETTKYCMRTGFHKDMDSLSDCSSSRSTPEGYSADKIPVLSESLNFVNSNFQNEKLLKDGVSKKNKTENLDDKNSKKSVEKNSNYVCWGDTEFEFNDDISHSEYDAPWDTNTSANVKPIKTSPKENSGSSLREEMKIKNEKPVSTGMQVCDAESRGDVIKRTEINKNMNNWAKHQERERKISDKEENSRRGIKSSIVSKDKNNRRLRRDKNENPLPPRFQKQTKSAVSEPSNEPSDVRSGGILIVPPNALSKVEQIPEKNILTAVNLPKHSPPQYFVHKQLFNPKNPKSPEIVNVPAPVNMTHFNSPNYCVDYMQRSDLSDYNPPSLLPSDNGFIPPPQPAPSISNPYQFQNNDFPLLSEVHESGCGLIENVNPSPPPVMCPLPNMHMLATPIQPPVYQNDYIVPPDSEKKRLKPIVEKNLKEISLLERELSSYLSKDIIAADLNALRQCRWKLQLRYENIILADPRYCAEKNAEQHLWKSAYYQIIEALRKNLEEQPQNLELKENLLNFVHEGTVFYENLLEKQQETYGFNLSQLLEHENLNGPCFPESLRLVLISTQKLLIYLGDLARYKEQTSGTTNFGKARNWYLKAQQIAPKNGRPYHQLAVLALCARRKLDAVYYFIRSLAASNPFLSAREYLLSLFEDAKKKYERFEKKRQEDIASEREIIAADSEERSEIWIKPDGTSCPHPTVLDEDRDATEFQKLSNAELNKRFVTSFLYVHGKLFTKVGMETFNEILTQMLKEFNFLLQRTPMILESSRFLQLCAINMYSVANASVRDTSYDGAENPLLLIQALHVSQAMMSLIIQRCCTLHKLHISSSEYPKKLIGYDFAQLFPAVKIWTDWMSCQRELWSHLPLFPFDNCDSSMELDVWASFADLLTCLMEIDTSSPEVTFERQEGFDPVILEEDNSMSGFVPLLGALQDPAYAKPPFDKDQAKQCIRIGRIQFFGDYLCGIPTPYLEFDVKHKKFVSLVAVSSEKDGNKTRKDLWENHKDDSFGDESLESEDILLQSSPDDEGNSEIKMLWSRKDALSRAKARQDRYQAQVQAVLQKHQRQRPIILQIQPRYLIPDTNCFIDHLQHLKNILESATFHLVVPLVVINELDGLARGTRPNPHTTPEHANKVTALSRASVSFLGEQFAARNPRLRAITSKGSVLDTISFRVEEIGHNKHGNNDDLILSCCLYYCKDRAEMYMPKNQDEPLKLVREIVLLTDDRNLRVKALTHNVPARDLMSFLEWVNS